MRLTLSGGADGDRTIEVGEEGVTTIGRESTCDLVLDDPEASREHASVTWLGEGRAEIRDLGSRNGTFVDGRRIDRPVTLTGGEEIRIGNSGIRVEGAAAETKLAGTPPATRPAPAPSPAAGAPPPLKRPPDRPSFVHRTQSALQRSMTERSARRATVIAGIAVVIAVVAVVLAVTGVFESEPPTVADIAGDDAVRSATVNVVAEKDGRAVGGGSGWVYDLDDGLIVTNAHVVGAGETFRVGLEGEDPQAATVVGVAPCDDLAVLSTDQTDGLTEMPLGSQSDVEQGDTVFVVGFPANASFEDELAVAEGTVTVTQVESDALTARSPTLITYPNAIETDARINPGNSGGPMLDTDRELVGVNTFGDPEVPGGNQNYAIGVDRVKEVVGGLQTGDSQGWAGFDFAGAGTLQDGTPALLVTTAVRDTTGAKAGFGKPRIAITAVNGNPVATADDYCEAVDGVASGNKVSFSGVIAATGEQFSVNVKLE